MDLGNELGAFSCVSNYPQFLSLRQYSLKLQESGGTLVCGSALESLLIGIVRYFLETDNRLLQSLNKCCTCG